MVSGGVERWKGHEKGMNTSGKSWFLVLHEWKIGQKNLILVIYAKSLWLIPINHFLFSKTSWRRLKDVFSVTIRLRRLPRSPQDIVKACLQDLFASTSWRRLERQKLLHLRRLEHVLNTSSLRQMFADLL